MKKIINSIQKALAKIEGKENRYSATVRQDVVRRAIERGEFLKIKCAYHYTDDYAWDAVNNHGKKDSVSKETMLREYSILTPSCWVDKKTHMIDGVECYEVSISFHQNLAYDMYVPLSGEMSIDPEEVILNYEAGEYCTTGEKEIDWIEEKKIIRSSDIEKLPKHLADKIIDDIISNFEWIKMKYFNRDEVMKYIDEYGIEARCEVNGIHGQKACLSLEDVWNNTFDLKYFNHVFTKGEKSHPLMKTIEIDSFGIGAQKTWMVKEKTLHTNGNTLFNITSSSSHEDAIKKAQVMKDISNIPVQIKE